jgi:hypothetical protein
LHIINPNTSLYKFYHTLTTLYINYICTKRQILTFNLIFIPNIYTYPSGKNFTKFYINWKHLILIIPISMKKNNNFCKLKRETIWEQNEQRASENEYLHKEKFRIVLFASFFSCIFIQNIISRILI